MTITGTNFTGATAVTFGGNPADQLHGQLGHLHHGATSPAGTGTVDVSVTTAAGPSATSASDQFTYVRPIVTASQPDRGPTGGGTTVTITGTGFTGDHRRQVRRHRRHRVTVNSVDLHHRHLAGRPPGQSTSR